MTLLVVGGTGLLGSNVCHHADRPVVGTYHASDPAIDGQPEPLDLRDRRRIDAVLDAHTPDAVVNCAALTDVDRCEREPDAAWALNADAPTALAAACAQRGIDLAHVGTDYVFDGGQRRPYTEAAQPRPINAYGESKLAGEYGVRDSHPDALVVRVAFLWGTHRGTGEPAGFPAWVRGQSGTVPAFVDQWVTPTRAADAARGVLELLDAGASGLVHLAGLECTTPYAMAVRLVGEARVEPACLTDVERAADRPAFSCLSSERAGEVLGWRPEGFGGAY